MYVASGVPSRRVAVSPYPLECAWWFNEDNVCAITRELDNSISCHTVTIVTTPTNI